MTNEIYMQFIYAIINALETEKKERIHTIMEKLKIWQKRYRRIKRIVRNSWKKERKREKRIRKKVTIKAISKRV